MSLLSFSALMLKIDFDVCGCQGFLVAASRMDRIDRYQKEREDKNEAVFFSCCTRI